MTSDARTWLAVLPDSLNAQRALLDNLLDAVERDPRWRWLELGCSVAQGRGDALSDLDLGLGVADDAFPQALDDLAALLTSLSPTVDFLCHQLAGVDLPHQRIFVQYADGAQIDLVAVPASLPKGTQPENIILYDPDGMRSERWADSVLQPDAATVREWAFLGWTALADLAKYLKRGSPWEARERLEQARTQIWRLWAVAKGVRYPTYGLTSVLDHPEAGLPARIEETIAGADADDLPRAALACATLLENVSELAAEVASADIPEGMASYVWKQLRIVEAAVEV